ncbi:MAG: DUF2520 domain-containing protein [bacterium]
MRIGVIGAGSIGRPLIEALKKDGKNRVLVCDKDSCAVKKGEYAALKSILECEHLFICVNDDATESVLKQTKDYFGRVVLLSASYEIKAVKRIMKKAKSVSIFHPIQSFSATSRRNPKFSSFYATLESTSENAFLLKFAEKNNIKIIKLKKPTNRKIYHLSAMLAGNYTLALLYIAEKLLKESTGINSLTAEVFLPMVRNIVERTACENAAEALSGPSARGDKKRLKEIMLEIKDAKLRNLLKVLDSATGDILRK